MMRYSYRTVLAVLSLIFMTLIVTVFPTLLYAEELEMINRPVNASGLTGLLETTAPYTLPPGTWEFGAGIVTQQSYTPDYSVSGHLVTISHGLTETMEIGLRALFLSEKESHKTEKRGVGDAELSLKWDLLPPQEFSSKPSVAVVLGGIAPTGDREEGTNTVEHWGGRLGLAIGSEVLIEDYVMGIYADGQAIVQDLSDEELRVFYHRANAGVLLPISKYRNLQMFIEYNRQKGKDVVALHDEDHSAVTYGLRLVSARFNLTIGTQFIHKYAEDQGDTSKISGIISIKL